MLTEAHNGYTDDGGAVLNSFFARLTQKFQQFMYGRYGTDKLNRIILIAAIVLEALYIFLRQQVFAVLSMILIAIVFFRMFSRNIERRQKENHFVLQLFSEAKMLKKYHIYKCPGCKQKIRVPRKGGITVDVSCPKCGTKFRKKI